MYTVSAHDSLPLILVFTNLLTYILTHISLTHSLTYSLTLTHSLTHLLTYSLTRLLTHSLTHLLARLLTYSLTYQLLTYRIGIISGVIASAVGCLVLVAACRFMMRRQKDNKVKFSAWHRGDQRPTRAVTAPECLGGSPHGVDTQDVSQLEMGAPEIRA